MYEQTANDLLKAMHEGLGGVSFSHDDSRNTLLAYFQQNLFAFSGAKSQAELVHFNSLLHDADGKLRSFQEFRNACFDAGLQFNKTWLQTEYITAVASAQSALNWESLKNADLLQYSTVGDDRVRPEHAELDGFTDAPDAPIWSVIYPPNDWLCRCTVIPGVAHNLARVAMNMDRAKEIVPAYFQRNTGTSKVLLDDSGYLQYQQGTRKNRLLGAEKNYAMQSVEDLYKKNVFPPKVEVDSGADAHRYFNDMAKAEQAIFQKDITGVTVKFDKEMVRHTIDDHGPEPRHLAVANMLDVVKMPDEIWSNRTKTGGIERFYIKYFEDFPIVVAVNDDEGMRAYTTYMAEHKNKLNVSQMGTLRRGTLLYRK